MSGIPRKVRRLDNENNMNLTDWLFYETFEDVNLRRVKSLIEMGADVNGVDTQVYPIDPDDLRHQIPLTVLANCLMINNRKRRFEVMKLLMESGADILAVDELGRNIVLHHAHGTMMNDFMEQDDFIETLQFLSQSGCTFYSKTFDKSFLKSCRHLSCPSAQAVFSKLQPDSVNTAEILPFEEVRFLEMAGCTTLIGHMRHDAQPKEGREIFGLPLAGDPLCLDYWFAALRARQKYESKGLMAPKKIWILSPGCLDWGPEFTNELELEALVSVCEKDLSKLYVQSIMISWRACGEVLCCECLDLFTTEAHRQFELGNKKLGKQIWQFLFTEFAKVAETQSLHVMLEDKLIVDLKSNDLWNCEGLKNCDPEDDVVTIGLGLFVQSALQFFMRSSLWKSVAITDEYYFCNVFHIQDFIRLFFKHTFRNSHHIESVICDLLRLNPTIDAVRSVDDVVCSDGAFNGTLLHFFLTKELDFHWGNVVFPKPVLGEVDFLLSHGADMYTVNSLGFTPLAAYLKECLDRGVSDNCVHALKVIELFVEHGYHIYCQHSSPTSVFQLLSSERAREHSLDVLEIEVYSLKCSAASVVKKHFTSTQISSAVGPQLAKCVQYH